MRRFGCLWLGLLIAVPAAALPSPMYSTYPASIRVVGLKNGVPDPAGTFEVVVRDLAMNPVRAGTGVVIDFSQSPGLELASDPRDPDMTVFCDRRFVRKFTDAQGRVRFTILGRGRLPQAPDEPPLTDIAIYADGVRFGFNARATSFDLDGTGGVGANDLALWIGDFGAADTGLLLRGDYDYSGTLGANDLSLWLEAFGTNPEHELVGSYCP